MQDYHITYETDADKKAIEALLDASFGLGRHQRHIKILRPYMIILLYCA
jgi:predicted N-acetyltransferase YhbS